MVQPAHKIHRERLPELTAEAKRKLEKGMKVCMHTGISEEYNIFKEEPEKWDKLNCTRFLDHKHLDYLYDLLMKA